MFIRAAAHDHYFGCRPKARTTGSWPPKALAAGIWLLKAKGQWDLLSLIGLPAIALNKIYF